MNRYAVEVKVTYHVSAKSISDAYQAITDGAEFPVMPYDDETYCNEVAITSIRELSNPTEPSNKETE
jgi:hypothetical protein